MSGFSAATATPAFGAPYQLDREQMVLRGRWRSYRRTLLLVLFLLVLQYPLRQVAVGAWDSTVPIRVEVPARLSLVVDAAMIAAYVVLAVRAFEMARFAADPTATRRRIAAVAAGLVVAGAALDVAENIHLWLEVGDIAAGASASLWWPGWSLLMRLLVGVGLVLGILTAALGRSAPPADQGPTAKATPKDAEQPELIICCSGGGIRATSFCLGGLQALEEQYPRAAAIVGVSGGGYIAAAFHVLRWRTGEGSATWGDLTGPPYAPQSPEERWLRRHTRYLFDSTVVGVFALLSLLFGLAVNLLFLTALLGAAAWVTGWFLLASGGVRDWAGPATTAADYRGDWAWADWSWVVLAAGIALFVLAKVVDRLFRTFDVTGRDRVRTIIVWTIAVGTAVLVAMLALPALLVALHDFARDDHTSPVAAALADLLGALGFAAIEVKGTATDTTETGASGLAVSGTSLAAIVATVVATVRALSSSLKKGAGDGSGSAVGALAGKAWRAVKDVVLPWLAAIVVVVLLVVVLLSWTVDLLNEPDLLGRWELVGIYGGLVLATFLLTDANRTSLHHYYRERLSSAYLVRRGRDGRPETIDYSEALRFSESNPARPEGDGGPALVSCAVANVTDLDVVPTDRDCTPFVFTHDRIGLTDELLPSAATVPSEDYEFAADSRFRDATIPAALAISGAAFSPLAGRENLKLGPYRLVLALANARLGVWLPNPLWIDQAAVAARRTKAAGHRGSYAWEAVKGLVTKPNPFLVAREAFGRTSVLDRFLYVTDGGHYDNLGLVEALRRRPKQVVVLDASNDPEDSLRTFGRAIATARMDLGCDIDMDPRQMRRLEEKRAGAAWGHGTIRYRSHGADGERLVGDLWIAKAIMLDDVSWDVETYQGDHPDFPRTSTGNQLYGEFDLEAYRALGADIVGRMTRPVPPA